MYFYTKIRVSQFSVPLICCKREWGGPGRGGRKTGAVRISVLRRGREGDMERRALSKRVGFICKALSPPANSKEIDRV